MQKHTKVLLADAELQSSITGERGDEGEEDEEEMKTVF